MRIRIRVNKFFSGRRIFPLKKMEQSTGTRVMAKTAEPSMAKVLVKAKGEKSFPACPLKEKTGIKATTIMRMAKKMAEPTSFEAMSRVLSFLSPDKAR